MIDYKINGQRVSKDDWDKKEFRLITIDKLSEALRPKDRLWDFTDHLNFKQPIHIHSKRQWEAECKKNNLVYRPARDTTQPKKFTPVPIETKKNLIREEMKKLGIYDRKKLFK